MISWPDVIDGVPQFHWKFPFVGVTQGTICGSGQQMWTFLSSDCRPEAEYPTMADVRDPMASANPKMADERVTGRQ